jgi:hypothetical protein
MPVFKDGAERFLLYPRIHAQSLIIRRSVISLGSSGAVAAEDALDPQVAMEDEIDPALVESRRYFTEFWSEFLAGWQLDDQRQPLPKPSRTTNLYFYLPPESKTWISAYVAKAKSRVGVYLTFERGPVAAKLYEGLLSQRSEIEKSLGTEVDWQAEGDGKYSIVARKSLPSVTDPKFRAEIIQWLRDTTNSFVTTFRPRIQTLLDEFDAV